MRVRPQRIVVGLGLLLAGVGLASLSWWGWARWRFQHELALARQEFNAGQMPAAGKRLAALSQRWPGHGEIEFWLGICEKEQGQTSLALEAWRRVPADAPEAPRALLESGRLTLERGRFAEAESYLRPLIQAGGETGRQARRLLGRLDWFTGRTAEFQRLLEPEIERSAEPSEVLRLHWSLDGVAYPFDAVQAEVEKARRAAPRDPRVWLALAHLATRAGRFDEAGEWLDRCEQEQPDDPVLAQARLDWARAADRPEAAFQALKRVPAGTRPRSELLALRAWFAAHAADRAVEEEALREWIAIEPGQVKALERLAALASESGRAEEAASLRKRKDEIDQALDRYRALMTQPDLVPHAPELARLADRLGRWVEARGWWALTARRHASSQAEARAALVRLAQSARPMQSGTGSLADLLAISAPPGGWKTGHALALIIPTFEDEAVTRGLRFTFEPHRTERCLLPETMSGGIGVLDFDRDGWLDVYAVQGGSLPPGERPFADRLFRNQGGGRFEDVTAQVGLGSLPGDYGHGLAVGDFDNDGYPDLFLTRWRSYALYHNVGGKRFEDVTESAGLGGSRDWPTSAAWADLDGDGDLDLYVCHYLSFDPNQWQPCKHPFQPGGCSYCEPRYFPAVPDRVFRNDGGRFVDVSDDSGISAADTDGRGLGVVAADLDDDGKTDVFVANDATANLFFRNQGGFRFLEQGHESGLATNAGGGFLAGMGVACGDLDGDRRLDVLVTNFYNESTSLYHNLGQGLFTDRGPGSGLTTATKYVLGFGIVLLDANNDGWLDIAQANGHVNDYRPNTPHAMPARLYLGKPGGRLVDVSDQAGPPWKTPRLGRGLAVADLDNDGRSDLLLVDQGAPLALFRNRTEPANHFLTLSLEGTTSNRDAVGARVTIRAGGRTQVRERMGGGSYLSASDPRLHFGIGAATTIEAIEVRWPSGQSGRYGPLAADAFVRIREGEPGVVIEPDPSGSVSVAP